VGQTRRTLKTRISEHMNRNTSQSSVTVHWPPIKIWSWFWLDECWSVRQRNQL